MIDSASGNPHKTRQTTIRRDVLYEVADGVAIVTLNRPQKLNAWTPALEIELKSAFQEAEHSKDVRVIVLTGAGRGFCAGADMSILSTLGEQSDLASTVDKNGLQENERQELKNDYSYFVATSKPIIAAINGPAVGLGLIMTLSCDLRLASDAATFGTAFARRGLIAEHGVAWLLPRIVGFPNALDLLLSARVFDADEAMRMGLIHRVLPQSKFLGKVLEHAQDLASNLSPRSMRVIKRQVYEAICQTLPEALATADREMVASFESEDFREGVAHFLAKRSPAFTGR
jgi:enoyl-CoA hydratase/carnithine racemase